MTTVQVDLPEDLLRAASVYANTHSLASASREVAKLSALELYREGSVSLGRAAELCSVSQAEFMQFAGEREVALHYTLEDLAQDCKFTEGAHIDQRILNQRLASFNLPPV
jgi:predicted HTH domain antitoxin